MNNITYGEWGRLVDGRLIPNIEKELPLARVEKSTFNGDVQVGLGGASYRIYVEADPRAQGAMVISRRVSLPSMNDDVAKVLRMLQVAHRLMQGVACAIDDLDHRMSWPVRVWVRDCPCDHCSGRGDDRGTPCEKCDGRGVRNDPRASGGEAE